MINRALYCYANENDILTTIKIRFLWFKSLLWNTLGAQHQFSDAPSTSFGNVSTQRQQHQPATQPTSSAWVRNTETRAPPIHEPSAPAVAMPEDSDNQFQRGRGRGRGGRGRGRGDGGPGSQQSGGQGSVGRGFHGPRDDYDGGQVLGGPSGGAVGGQESIQAQQPVRPKTSQR